jgi:hypothetical protein
MFRQAVHLPECLDEFLNIFQVLNVQKPPHHYFFHSIQMNLGYNETAFVMPVLLQLGRQNLRN